MKPVFCSRSRIFFLVAVGVLFGVMLLAQQPPAVQQPPATQNHIGPSSGLQATGGGQVIATPLIPAVDRAEFFKRQVALLQAQQAMTAAQTEFQKAVEQLTKDCGERFLPQVGPTGDPICAARAELAKPAGKK